VSAVLGPDCRDRKHVSEFRALGVDTVVSITTDPVDLIARKIKDMRLTTAVLSTGLVRLESLSRE